VIELPDPLVDAFVHLLMMIEQHVPEGPQKQAAIGLLERADIACVLAIEKKRD